MAASVPAKPNKAGGRDERFDVVRVRSSSVDACAALQEQTANCKTRFSRDARARATEPNRCPALPKRSRELPACCQSVARPGAPRSADASGLQAVAVAGEHPYSLA